MLRGGLIGVGLFVLLGSSGLAGTGADERSPDVSFDAFPIPIKRFHMVTTSGTPVTKAVMDSPWPGDFPPAVVVYFDDVGRNPSLEEGPKDMTAAVLRVYNISAMKTAPYQTIQSDVNRLRQLLKTRPAIVHQSKTSSKNDVPLPDYPPSNAAHLIEVKGSFVDAPWGSGLLYVTQFVQGLGEWPDNEQLVYLLRGLSKDGRFYISADFRVTHPSLENAKPATQRWADADKLTDKLSSIMSKDRDESFTPSLRKIRDWVLTLKIE